MSGNAEMVVFFFQSFNFCPCQGRSEIFIKSNKFDHFLRSWERTASNHKNGSINSSGQSLSKGEVSFYRECTLILGSWEKILQGFILQAEFSNPDIFYLFILLYKAFSVVFS